MLKDGLDSDKLKALFRGGKRFDYQKNTTILRARETPRGVYLIESGILKMYSLSKQGDEHILDFFGPGDIFPMTWPFRRSVRSMYYETISPATMRMIEQDKFRELLAKNSDAMSDVLEELIDRYHQYVARIDNLLYSDALERSAYRLLSLADRFGVKTGDGLVIEALITHEDLAHSISTTRETFGRSLARLQRKNILGHDDRHHIVIRDLTSLSDIIGRDETKAMWPGLMQYIN
jgi:CRP/FNR family transcriptional regulator, anaerobic regulatory protein